MQHMMDKDIDGYVRNWMAKYLKYRKEELTDAELSHFLFSPIFIPVDRDSDWAITTAAMAIIPSRPILYFRNGAVAEQAMKQWNREEGKK